MLELILHFEATPIAHRLQLRMVDVGRDDHAARQPTSSRTNSGVSFSRSATKSISSVTRPLRAKCICDMLLSPVPAASSRRRAIHSARNLGMPVPAMPFGFPLSLPFVSHKTKFSLELELYYTPSLRLIYRPPKLAKTRTGPEISENLAAAPPLRFCRQRHANRPA